MTTTLCPFSLSRRRSQRDVGLFPLPVRDAQTDTNGLEGLIIVASGPRRTKEAPAARTLEASFITYSWGTSL